MLAHASYEEKLAAARRLRDELGIARPILVDDWEGTVHIAYGALPNMCWVLDRGGVILYKGMWTSADRVAEFLARQDGAPRGNPLQAPFHTEQLELRQHDRGWFKQVLERNGPRSVAEFARAEEIWAERIRARRAGSEELQRTGG